MIYPSSKFSEREQKNKTDSEDHTTNRVTVYFYFLLFYALNVFIRKKNKCSNVFLSITLYFSCLLCQRELANKSVKLYKLNLGLFNLVNQYDFRNGNPLQYSCLENPMDGGAWQATVHGVLKSWTLLSDFTFTFHFSLSCIGGGNGNSLQCSCLENPRDRGAWRATIYGVTQSRTWLKWHSSGTVILSGCLIFKNW